MLDCNCLIHPFQNDPGTSQRQRTMEDLLAGAAKIDARTLADLLDYFVQLSGHINYYDFELNVKDWQPFFKKSIPFALAVMIKYPLQNVEDNFKLYKSIFEKKSSVTGLQLSSFFIYYRFINTINEWQKLLQDSGLPIAQVIDELIKNKLQQPVKWFIRYSNAAVKAYGIKRIDFSKLSGNAIWGIVPADITATDTAFSTGTRSKLKKLRNLYDEFNALFPILLNVIKLISKEAEKNLEKSFIPLQVELQQQHQPQLALIFAFLNMFRQLQNDLNKYKQKHLDYFYKDILQFKSAAAVADKAHVIFELQKQLESYLLKKGLLVKDGKDDKKQQILFSLDDDIVVTKTTIADKRTLFLNNKSVYTNTYVEGVYMAPIAGKADGIEIDFKEDPKNFPTLGETYSKYVYPDTKLIKPYPNARLGFILGSPVLYMQAGSTRTIDINLECYLNDELCDKIAAFEIPKNCCSDNAAGTSGDNKDYPVFYLPESFFSDVNAALANTYYYFNQDLLKLAQKKGISATLIEKLKKYFLLEEPTFDPKKEPDYCTNCAVQKDKYEGVIDEATYQPAFLPEEREILLEWIKPRKALNVLFSGEKEWVAPVIDPLFTPNFTVSMGALVGKKFTLTISATLTPDKPAVTFYDKEKLKEDFNATQPLVKIELDDKIKLIGVTKNLKGLAKKPGTKDKCCVQTDECCMLIEPDEDATYQLSLYHFFRNVIIDNTNPNAEIIKVKVCGLKNFIVQNDEAVMDVNGPIYPFGARPDIIDFRVTNLAVQYIITIDLITDVTPNVAGTTVTALNGLLPASGIYQVGNSYADIEGFLSRPPINATSLHDRGIIRDELRTKNYSKKNLNLIGPNFFIGSKEIFCKHWTEVFINLNWKDKPADFRDFYKAYLFQNDYITTGNKLFGLDDQEFEINISVLENSNWISELKHEDAPLKQHCIIHLLTSIIEGYFLKQRLPPFAV
jgi:hypothetical protein